MIFEIGIQFIDVFILVKNNDKWILVFYYLTSKNLKFIHCNDVLFKIIYINFKIQLTRKIDVLFFNIRFTRI